MAFRHRRLSSNRRRFRDYLDTSGWSLIRAWMINQWPINGCLGRASLTISACQNSHEFKDFYEDSATSIVEQNNLDSNAGTGSFGYDLSERSAYIKRLTEAGALSRSEGDSDILTLSTNDSRWEIQLHRNSGGGEWIVRDSCENP
jgi:hypothetical protein